MALESVFVCSRTINALRSGPLGEILDDYCDWMLGCGFKRITVRGNLANVSRLNAYLAKQKKRDRRCVSSEDVDGFFKEYSSRVRHEEFSADRVRRIRWSVNRFICYLRRQNRFESLVKPAAYQPILEEYLDWMRDYQHAAAGTLGIRSHCLARFLQWIGPQATVGGLRELTAETVEQFLLSYAREMGMAALRSMQSSLRTFFRFCLHQGYVRLRLDLAVPTLRTYKLATVPLGLTDEQARRVLEGISRDSKAGQTFWVKSSLLT